MTDTEPTPPARPEGSLDDTTPAASPWAAEPPRYAPPADAPPVDPWRRPQDEDGRPSEPVEAGSGTDDRAGRGTDLSRGTDDGESGGTDAHVAPGTGGGTSTQPLPPVAAQPWASEPASWAQQPGQYGQAGGYGSQPGQYGQQTRQAGRYGGQPGHLGQYGEEPGRYAQAPAAPAVDTLGRTRRGRGGRAGFVALVVALALVAGLVGGVRGSLVVDRDGLTALVGGGEDTGGSGDGSASSADEPDDADPAAAPVAETGSVAEIAARVLPSVVSISVSTGQGNGTGSGFVIDDEGLIVTNNHVIAAGGTEPAGDIVVELSDGSQAEAEVVGTDASYDIAVLRVDPADTGGLTQLPFGDSDRVVVGEQVVAVGAPLGLDATVTTGIVSALNRPVSAGAGAQETAFINAIQTDAAINPGNSGGPLVNMRGEVVGVNSAIAQAPGGQTGGSIGLGFSIPSNQAERTAGQLVTDGVATFPVVGVLLDRSYTGEGVRIVTEEDATDADPVTPGGPADAAGLQAGDVILAFDGRPMTESDELVVAIRAREPGDEVTLTVRRDDEVFDVSLVLEAGDQD